MFKIYKSSNNNIKLCNKTVTDRVWSVTYNIRYSLLFAMYTIYDIWFTVTILVYTNLF